MIKPSETNPDQGRDRHGEIEACFDIAVRQADQTGQWPALVSWTPWRASHVADVIKKYQAEGWVVTIGYVYVRIDHRRETP